jgi:hypothetical protein
MSSNLPRSFLFKCRNKIHIIPWPLVTGWGNNKENYFCRWLHDEISQYYLGKRCGPWASCILKTIISVSPSRTGCTGIIVWSIGLSAPCRQTIGSCNSVNWSSWWEEEAYYFSRSKVKVASLWKEALYRHERDWTVSIRILQLSEIYITDNERKKSVAFQGWRSRS